MFQSITCRALIPNFTPNRAIHVWRLMWKSPCPNRRMQEMRGKFFFSRLYLSKRGAFHCTAPPPAPPHTKLAYAPRYYVDSYGKICSKIGEVMWKSGVEVRGELSYFGAPRQWKHLRPLFQAVFFRGGGVRLPPDWVKHHASQSQDRNNKYFILCIEFVAADLLFRLARMRHAWKGDCYLTVLVFSWQILFLLS